MNSVQLIGRLTKDIQVNKTQSGLSTATFTLAVNRNFRNANGEYEADFILCQVWRGRAENLAQFTHKGSRIGINGRIQTRNYENQDGQRVYVTEVIVDNFYLLDPKPSQNNSNPNGSQYGSNTNNQQQNNNYAQQNQQNMNNQQNQWDRPDWEKLEVNEDDLPF